MKPRKYNPIKVKWTCPECERISEVIVYPVIPAKLNGPPEKCYPEEGGEYEPDQCECGKKIDYDEAHELANEAYESFLEDYYERQVEDLKDRKKYG